MAVVNFLVAPISYIKNGIVSKFSQYTSCTIRSEKSHTNTRLLQPMPLCMLVEGHRPYGLKRVAGDCFEVPRPVFNTGTSTVLMLGWI